MISSSRRSVLSALATLPLTSSSAAATRATASLQSAAATRGQATVTPEQFGAIGDGVADDAPAIQRAMDALAARGPQGPGGTVILQPKIAYRCNSGLMLDATHVSLWGNALLDFSGWSGRYLRVVATSAAHKGKEPDNNFGYKGMVSGAIRLKGAGPNTSSVGIDFDSPNLATSAQLLIQNMSVSNCGVGLRFGNRAYNNLLIHCEVFDCQTCVLWPSADDNGERNTLISCVLYNSDTAVHMDLGSASLHLQSCSIDYTRSLYAVRAGSILADSCHHESNIWRDKPVFCSGDGSFIHLDGGMILNQAEDWQARNMVDVSKGGTVRLSNMFAHNIALTSPDPTRPASWATGDGEFRMTGTQSFNYGKVPIRLQEAQSLISDPDFRSVFWEDMVWRTRDTTPITNRYADVGSNLSLSKASVKGDYGLLVQKNYGSTSAAGFMIVALPVRYGDTVLTGFRVRRSPDRPGKDGSLLVSPTWVRLDGEDRNHVPVVVRSLSTGSLAINPEADRFLLVSPMASRAQRIAPPWATHFCMFVDLVKAHEASFLFNGLWADIM